MSSALPNPDSPPLGSFLPRLRQTRSRLRELEHWRPANDADSVSAGGRPKVSIMLITYNHERYVAQALDSVLRQQRDFDIEINAIDDASTDGTQAIIRAYQEMHPSLINCYFNAENAGRVATQLNTIRGFQTLRGQYFALLEGDDYWTDDNKLATQVAFLDANDDFVACAHYTLKVFDDNSRPPEHFLPFIGFGRDRATLDDLIPMNAVFHLSSILYRNVFGLTPPLCLSDPYSCEVTINMTYGIFGDFFCFDRYMSVYRVHGGGTFSGRSLEKLWLFHLHGYRRFALYLGPRHWLTFVAAIFKFSRYVLAAPKNRVAPELALKTRTIFWLHLIAVAPPVFAGRLFQRATRTLRKLRKKRRHKLARSMCAQARSLTTFAKKSKEPEKKRHRRFWR